MNELASHDPPPACLTAGHALRARHHAPRGRRFYSNEVSAYDGPRPPRASGNRTSHTVGATPYAYTYPATSHRLTSFTGPAARSYTYDGHRPRRAAGNIAATSSGFAFSYDGPRPRCARGRMTHITAGSVNQYGIKATAATSGINALGQRLTKAGTGYTGTLRFVYGEDGKLLGEYDNTGAYLIQADHLNTPRAILGASNALVWKWDSDAFGTTAANENPSALGTFNYNPRFPGQYYDKESALHYNYFRDSYNPKTGRYFQSDPIGLKGGINTYAYVGGNPITQVDPDGQFFFVAAFGWSAASAAADFAVATAAALYANQSLNNQNVYSKPDPLSPAGGEEHTSGARPSTGDKHDLGKDRKKTDRGGERGDDARDWPRRRPKGWTGPWPPTPKTPDACEK